MSLLPTSPGAARAYHVPPLTVLRPNGKVYVRRRDIEERIASVFRDDPTRWVQEAKKDLPAEVLIHLIRYVARYDRNTAGDLIFELSKRVQSVVLRWARGFSQVEADRIIETIQRDIIEFVLAEQPSLGSDFLEVAFSEAVKRRTIKLVAKAQRLRPVSLSTGVTTQESDLPDLRLNGLEELLRLDSLASRREMLDKARAAVKDPRHFEALLLRYGHDWPIESENADVPTLATRFGVSPRQIRNWIMKGLESIRTALGVQL